MSEKKEFCTCDKCGNEAEMLITCEWVDVARPSGGRSTSKIEPQDSTRVCRRCGNEANMIIGSES